MQNKIVQIYTDGACRGNPGVGGWGVLMRYGAHEKTLLGAEANTTNNRMELFAVIAALRMLKRPCCIEVTTDSQYVHRGVTQWMSVWKRHRWLNSEKKEVKNRELWEQLDIEIGRHINVRWHWVKGHSGHFENEAADKLANEAIDVFLREKHS